TVFAVFAIRELFDISLGQVSSVRGEPQMSRMWEGDCGSSCCFWAAKICWRASSHSSASPYSDRQIQGLLYASADSFVGPHTPARRSPPADRCFPSQPRMRDR